MAKNGPRNATTGRDGRFYTWNGLQFWSVTTVLGGGIPKPAIPNWAALKVAEGAVDMLDQVRAIVAKDKEGGRDAAIRMLKGLPWDQRDRAANVGTEVHQAIESHVLGRPMPPWPLPLKPFMAQFERFITDYQPVFEASEASVYNRRYAYAGTLDAIALIGGRRFLIDVKTSEKGPYPEVGAQMAAYRNAEFVGLADGSEQPMPPVDACAVLKLNADKYELIEVRADDEIFHVFLYAAQIHRFQTEVAKTVIGGLVPFPAPPAPAAEAGNQIGICISCDKPWNGLGVLCDDCIVTEMVTS